VDDASGLYHLKQVRASARGADPTALPGTGSTLDGTVYGAAPANEPRPVEHWQVAGPPTNERLASWGAVLADTHVPFEVRATGNTPSLFNGAVSRCAFGELTLVDCVCTPFAGYGSGTPPDDTRGEFVGLQWVRQGLERVGSGDALTMTAGDLILWDGTRPTEVEVLAPFFKRTLLLPRNRVLSECPQLGDAGAIRIGSAVGSARLLTRYLNALAIELPSLNVQEAEVAVRTLYDLLAEALRPAVPSSREARRTAQRASVRRYIYDNLSDPALTPPRIAAANAMSLRALHALFEETDESVAQMIRRERLRRAFDDLTGTRDESVSDVALRWGFSDAAHFSRVFKREYGMSPSDLRDVSRNRRERTTHCARIAKRSAPSRRYYCV
jgi:AraC family transcriptional regulator, positive regulator of tynA and feaB